MAIAVVFAIIAFYLLDSEFLPHVWKGETLAPELQMIALPVPTLRQNLSGAGFLKKKKKT